MCAVEFGVIDFVSRHSPWRGTCAAPGDAALTVFADDGPDTNMPLRHLVVTTDGSVTEPQRGNLDLQPIGNKPSDTAGVRLGRRTPDSSCGRHDDSSSRR